MKLIQAIEDNIEHMDINGEKDVPYVRLQYINDELEDEKEKQLSYQQGWQAGFKQGSKAYIGGVDWSE